MTFEQQLQELVRRELEPLRAEVARLQAKVATLEAGTSEELISPAQAAKLTGFAPATIRDWARAGRLTRHGTEARVRVSRAEVLAEAKRGRSPRPSNDDVDVKDLAAKLWKKATGG